MFKKLAQLNMRNENMQYNYYLMAESPTFL